MLSEALAAAGVPSWLRVLLIDANRTLGWSGGVQVIVSYPVLPWFAVMAAGYGFGACIRARPSGWAALAARIGFVLGLGFVVLRATGAGLDPEPWLAGADGRPAILSFLNCEKYPPSPLFLLMTLSPLMLLLALLERRGAGSPSDFLQALGHAPLFFYILHLYVFRAAGLAPAAMVWGIGSPGAPPLRSAPEWPLWSAWMIWALAMFALYRPTRWFADIKRRHREWWTSYL